MLCRIPAWRLWSPVPSCIVASERSPWDPDQLRWGKGVNAGPADLPPADGPEKRRDRQADRDAGGCRPSRWGDPAPPSRRGPEPDRFGTADRLHAQLRVARRAGGTEPAVAGTRR